MRDFLLLSTLFIFTSCMGDKEVTPPPETTTKEVERETVQSGSGCSTAVFVTDPHYTDTPLKIDSEEEELRYALENYFDQLKSLNADNIISMTYPKLFIPINRDMFRQYINTMLNSQDLSIVNFQTTVTQIDPINCFSNISFAQIGYLSEITINFVNPQLYSDELKMRFLADVMSRKYGEGNIRINSRERTITIRKEERLLAIKEDGIWTFLGDNPEYRRLYPRILPREVLDSI